MRVIIKFSLCLLVILTFGCGNRKGIEYENAGQGGSFRIWRRIFDERGDLTEEAQLSKDSIRDGFYKKYASGKIESIGYYKGNRRDSSWLYFNPSGDTIRKENWFNGKPFGEQFQFYSKAPGEMKSAIHKYGFDNLDGEKVFLMSFDSLSAIKSFEGSPVYTAYTSDTIKVNSDFDLMYFFGIPPSCHYAMAIREWDNVKKQLSLIHVSDTSKNLQDLFFGKKYMISKNYKNKGVYDWQLDLVIEDGKNNVIVHDTSALRIKVE
jgi:antitoxin component YwqK of YwqJK toxin-antitoxin module